MKLELTGHNYQYAAEQIMTVLFPGEKPVYGPVGPEDEDWARIRLSVGGTYAVAVTVLHRAGKETRGESRVRACRLEEDALPSRSELEAWCNQVLSDYQERVPGARTRVAQVLEIILTAWLSALLKREADRRIAGLDGH